MLSLKDNWRESGMENYLVLNGQKIELTPEQYQGVCNAVSPKKSPFDRKEKDETYSSFSLCSSI